jgi:Ca-activated chloride channel family protein
MIRNISSSHRLNFKKQHPVRLDLELEGNRRQTHRPVPGTWAWRGLASFLAGPTRVQNHPEHRATGASKTLRNAGKLATIVYLEKSAGWRFESFPVHQFSATALTTFGGTTRLESVSRERLRAGAAAMAAPETGKLPSSTMRVPVLILSFAFFVPMILQAQEQDPSVMRVAVNLVMVDVTAKTKAGQILGDLKKEDFELREDGAAQKVEIFSRDELPLNVALVLDLSDSIEPFLGPLRDAANTALGALKPEDQAALFTFSTDAELRVPFTSDKKKLAEQINAFKVGGATNINDGIFVPAKYLLNAPQRGRRVIILISDDVATYSGGQGTHDIITELIASDAVLYNLKIPGYNPPGTMLHAAMEKGLVNLRAVMDQTGGEVFNVQDVSHLDETFRALIERIKTRYTLGYYTKASAAEGKPHKLDVRLAASFGKKGRDYVVLSKNGFYVH